MPIRHGDERPTRRMGLRADRLAVLPTIAWVCVVAATLWACGSDQACTPRAVVDCECAQGAKVEVVCGADGVAPPCLCGSGKQSSGQLDWSASDAVVVDAKTGLMWQRKVDGQVYNWSDAKAFCLDLTLAGFDDWLLPHKDDLFTIVMATTTAPSIDTVAFPDTPSKPFWTRTLYGPQSDTSAWGVDFHDGGEGYALFAEQHHVRCVRTP